MYIYIGDDLVLYENHELSASICISADDIVFPYPEYRDFLYPILCDWSDILLGHTNSKTARYELRFLGSGYQMNLSQDSEKMVDIDFRYADKHFGQIRISYDALLNALYSALIDFQTILYHSDLSDNSDLVVIKNRISECIQACKVALNQ